MVNPEEVTSVLSILTLISDVALVFGILLAIGATVTKKRKLLLQSKPFKFLDRYGLLLAFIVALVATSGSLYYSEVALYPPCKLCWFQRIFMYPQVILLGMSLYRKEKSIIPYSIGLSIVGGLIAAYHYYMQVSPSSVFIPCSTVGISVSCTAREFTHLGYITIPMMSLTAFLLIIALLGYRSLFRNER